jgi:phosphoribosylamine-glycine ligase
MSCRFKMIEGTLNKIELIKAATVVTYKVPASYGGYAETFQVPDKADAAKPVDLAMAYDLNKRFGDDIRIYPGAMEQRDHGIFALKSRAVCAVGIGDTIEAARQISLAGIGAIMGGALWNRNDIASENNIRKSKRHLRKLRRAP